MPSITLVEAAKLTQDRLVAGIIETIVTVDEMFEVLPFEPIQGSAITYNREDVAGDVQVLGVGGTITAKAAATVTQLSQGLTTIIGDAEVNGLIQATQSDINDQTGTQIASKAKSTARNFKNQFINGSGSNDEFDGLLSLCAAGQTTSAGTNGANLAFSHLDILLDAVVDKEGKVDYITMNSRTRRSYFDLLRNLGGTNPGDAVTLPSGTEVPAYRFTPIFRNDFIPITQTKGNATTATTVFAGTFDDGSQKIGISGLTALNAAGIQVEYGGIHATKDEKIWRVKWYCSVVNFSQLGLACVNGILN